MLQHPNQINFPEILLSNKAFGLKEIKNLERILKNKIKMQKKNFFMKVEFFLFV
tara:strand:- start:419 stop:580 length:162 start_codon:yes stop_codon:yes gene_type:complete